MTIAPPVNPPSVTTTLTYRIPGPVVVRDTIYTTRYAELHSITVTYCDGVEVDWAVEGWHLTAKGLHWGHRRQCFPPVEDIEPYLVDARARMFRDATDRLQRLGATAEQATRWSCPDHFVGAEHLRCLTCGGTQ